MTLQSPTASVAHPAQVQSARQPGLDVAKFVAVVGVIWIHACRSNDLASTSQLARFAVPFFTAAAAYGLVRSLAKRQPTFAQFAMQKAMRLYLPFIIWSVLYLLFKIGKRLLLPEQDCDLPGWEFCWIGGAYHLWFIPFLVVSSLVLFPVLVSVQQGLISHRVAAVTSGIIGLVVALAVPMDDGSGAFLLLVGQALPGLFWGCSLGWCSLIEPPQRTQHAIVSTAAASLVVCLVCLSSLSRETLIENAAGCCLLLIALNFSYVSFPAWLSRAGELSFGIYFVHLMILKMSESLMSKLHFEVTAVLDIALFLTTTAFATAFSFVFSRWAQTRWLVT